MKYRILDTMPSTDKQQFFYLVEYTNDNGRKAKKWLLYAEMPSVIKNMPVCMCLTYTIYGVYDTLLCEKRDMTRSGAIFNSIDDFEIWKQRMTHYCEFTKLEILCGVIICGD